MATQTPAAEMERPRGHWHALLESRGYVPMPAITKSVALLLRHPDASGAMRYASKPARSTLRW